MMIATVRDRFDDCEGTLAQDRALGLPHKSVALIGPTQRALEGSVARHVTPQRSKTKPPEPEQPGLRRPIVGANDSAQTRSSTQGFTGQPRRPPGAPCGSPDPGQCIGTASARVQACGTELGDPSLSPSRGLDSARRRRRGRRPAGDGGPTELWPKASSRSSRERSLTSWPKRRENGRRSRSLPLALAAWGRTELHVDIEAESDVQAARWDASCSFGDAADPGLSGPAGVMAASRVAGDVTLARGVSDACAPSARCQRACTLSSSSSSSVARTPAACISRRTLLQSIGFSCSLMSCRSRASSGAAVGWPHQPVAELTVLLQQWDAGFHA